MEEQPTLEEIQQTIRAARDSVWVIEDTIEKINNGSIPNEDRKSDIERNVGHLKIITSRDYIVNSGEDISDLLAGITLGEDFLANTTWVE